MLTNSLRQATRTACPLWKPVRIPGESRSGVTASLQQPDLTDHGSSIDRPNRVRRLILMLLAGNISRSFYHLIIGTTSRESSPSFHQSHTREPIDWPDGWHSD
jgi:hypothetical protein